MVVASDLNGLGEILVLPVGDGQEHGHDQGGNELHIVAAHTQTDNHLIHHIVDDGTQNDAQQLQGEVVEDFAEDGFVSANRLEMKDSMEISVSGNEERILLIARYDNLGKGASGSAVECMNIVLGADKTEGLEI